MMDMKKVVLAYLIFLIIFTGSFLFYNLFSFSNLGSTGSAYYVSDSGISIRDPESPLPSKMMALNIVFWTVNLIGLILLLSLVRSWAAEPVPDKAYDKKRHKSSRRKRK